MSTDTPAQAKKRCQYCDDTGDVHTPTGEWRGDCICEAGKALFMDRPPVAASPQPAAAQPLTDEQIDAVALHTVYDDDDTCAYRDAWCREVGRPFARAIERAHGIGASAAPAQAAQHLLQDTDRKLFDALARDPNARQHVRDSAEAIKDAQAVAELVEALEFLLTRWDGCDEDDTPPAVVRVRAALDRLKTPNVRAERGA
mgnify:CR=1 FL=1